MITPLKKHPGQRGGFIAILVLVTATVVVWTTQPPKPKATETRPQAPSPGAIAPLTPPQPPSVEQRTKTAILDDSAPLIATGSTSYDETRTSHVGVPVHGWMKKTRATSLGRTVRSGEVLAIVYSPEVFLTTASVLTQLRSYAGDQAPLDAERWKLLRWGMLQSTLSRIERTFTPQAALPLLARVSGIVVAEAGAPAQLVEPSELELFTITDPAYAWVFVDVPDAFAARLAPGTPATITIEGVARPVTLKVAHVYRHSEDGMRKVRFDLHGPLRSIKPNLPVTAAFPRP